MDFSSLRARIIAYLGETNSPLDITRGIRGAWSIKSTALDIVGWVGFSAELTLHQHPDLENLSTRENPLRWCKGNRWTFEIQNSQGQWVLVRTLRSLNAYYKKRTQNLRVQLGDRYLLKNSRRPPGDAAPIYVSSGVSVRDWANAQLAYFGLPTLATGLGDPTLDELIFGSMPYEGGGNILDHIGQGIWANTGCYLYLDSRERSRVVRPNFAPTSAAVVGEARDFEPYEESDGEQEQPAGRVRVLGNPQFVFPYTDPQSITISTTQGAFTRTETTTESSDLVSRTVTMEGTETVTGLSAGGTAQTAGGPYRTTHVENYSGGTPPYPNPDPDLPATPGTPPRLVEEIDTVEQTPEVPNSAGGGGSSIGLQQAKKSTKTYSYHLFALGTTNPSLINDQITEVEERNQGFSAVSGGTSSGNTVVMVPDRTNTKNWDQVGGNRWRYRETTIDLAADQSDRRQITISSSPGSSEPPATRFRPKQFDIQSIDILGIARFSYPPGAPDNDHPRDYNLGKYIHSKPAAEARAKELGAMLIGRHEGQDIGFVAPDSWLGDWKPGQVAFVQRNAELDDVWLLDSTVLYCAERRTYIGAEGIWLGTRRTNGVVSPPFEQTYFLWSFEAGGSLVIDAEGNTVRYV
jgi:hypothetical protein